MLPPKRETIEFVENEFQKHYKQHLSTESIEAFKRPTSSAYLAFVNHADGAPEYIRVDDPTTQRCCVVGIAGRPPVILAAFVVWTDQDGLGYTVSWDPV